MTEVEIEKDHKQNSGEGGFRTKTALAEYMKKRKQGESDELLADLDYIPDGRGRTYFIPDVAEKIMQERVRSI